MTDLVIKYIEENGLLTKDKPVLVALSGGRDSVVLLDILNKIGYECIALHCNFHLRGAESDRDEQFVRSLCEQKGINLTIRHFDTVGYSKEKNISVEMAARELRYAWFEKMLLLLKGQAIAVAHHKDDRAETLLLNIIRGTGLRGLCAMRCKNGNVIRPLLCVSRQQIDRYVNDNNLQYTDDSTNNETVFKRNKIRHDILPTMAEINPAIIDTLNNEAEIFRRTNALMEYYVTIEQQRICKTENDYIEIDTELLQQHPLAQDLLYEIIRDYGFNYEQCSLIYENIDEQSGKRFLSAEYKLLKDRNTLIIYPRKQDKKIPQIEVLRRERNKQEPFPPTNANHAFFDTSILDHPLTLRHWQYGDTFHPLGMTESRKLSDFFNDRKISVKRKHELWLLTSGEDIAWIIGERIDNRFKVGKKSTEIVEIKITED